MRSIGIALSVALLFAATTYGQDQQNLTGPVTFYKDVLPVLQAKCQSCHRPGEMAPMSFLTYESTRPWAKAMKAATSSRKMPPWNLDPQYGHFKDDAALSEKELATIGAWVDGGALEGNVKDAPPPVEFVQGWRSKPDVILEMPAFDVPAKGVVEGVNVVLKNPFKEDTWAVSIEIRPGERSVVHHAGVTFVPHKEGVPYNIPVWSVAERDEFGVQIPGTPRGQFFTYCKDDRTKACPIPNGELPPPSGAPNENYRPGVTPLDYSYYNSAILIPANTDIVVNMHYSTVGKAATDVTHVGITLAKKPPQNQLYMSYLEPRGDHGWSDHKRFRIPAGDSNWESAPADAVFNMDCELAVLSIHMHELGKDMTYTLLYPDGRSETILKSPNYDFNWQITYNLEKPIKIPKGTKLRVTAHYNNSRSNKYARYPDHDIYGGQQSWEEMMSPWIGLLLPMNVDPHQVYTKNIGDEQTFFSSPAN
jgi:copper type II ascorbate-dependent monooxygenase-like protein